VSPRCGQKLARLQAIVAERTAWANQLAQVKRMHGWVLEVEHILDGSLTQATEERMSNEMVGSRLDAWRERMVKHLSDGTPSELEQECLTTLLQVLTNLRPHLVECYDRADFPRTNNEMERCIRGLKTQYRRISGRKNWNAYLLRYGRCVAYAAWWEQDAAHRQQFEQRTAKLDCKSHNYTGEGVQLSWWLLACFVFSSSRLRGETSYRPPSNSFSLSTRIIILLPPV